MEKRWIQWMMGRRIDTPVLECGVIYGRRIDTRVVTLRVCGGSDFFYSFMANVAWWNCGCLW